MKLLYLPLIYNGSNNEQKYLEAAFRKKCSEVKAFDFLNTPDPDNALKALVKDFMPDVVHCQFQGTDAINPEALEKLKQESGFVLTQWTGDVRDTPISEYIKYGKVCDINFVSASDDIEIYQDKGLKDVRYWQNAIADPEQIGEPASNPAYIIFCGGNYECFSGSKERRELVSAFRGEFGDMFKVYGPGWENSPSLPWDEQTDMYSRHYLILGHNNVSGKRWWFSDRQLIAMGSGRPHLCEWSRDIEELFDDGEDCVFYRSIDEAISKAKWLLENRNEAADIGRQGQRTVRKYHTWDRRVDEYLSHISDYV